MNLGRIYSLEKDLLLVQSFEDLANHEVMGLVWKSEYSSGDMLEMFDALKNEFLNNYGDLLKSAKLKEASFFWENLVSSKKVDQNKKQKIKLTGDFYEDLSSWTAQSGKLSDLQPIIDNSEIQISDNLDKYSLVYGLKVLIKLGELLNVKIEDSSASDSIFNRLKEDSHDPKFAVDSIVITTSIYESLFTSCGLPTMLIGKKDREEIKDRIINFLEQFPTVKIALIMGLDQSQEDYLVRQFGKKLQVCTIPTATQSQNEKVNTFEKIGVSTIGLRPSKIIKQNSK